MTTDQKAHLTALLDRETLIKNAPLIRKRNDINKLIISINAKLSDMADSRTILIAKRDAITDAINERLSVAEALSDVIVVD